MTQVVNVRVDNIRPQYDNLREWMQDPQNVYIGRARIVFIDGKRYPAEDSPWANPYKIDVKHPRDKVLKKYKKYIKEKLESPLAVQELFKLRGKKLGCWCSPEPCHGDILINLLNELWADYEHNNTIFVSAYQQLGQLVKTPTMVLDMDIIKDLYECIAEYFHIAKRQKTAAQQAEEEKKYADETPAQMVKRGRDPTSWVRLEQGSDDIIEYTKRCNTSDICWYSGNLDRCDGCEIFTLPSTEYMLCDQCLSNNLEHFMDKIERQYK